MSVTYTIAFPTELPIIQRLGELQELIKQHQVIIVAGETGSGKTTQLPKICLSLGRGVEKMIGHTQPRRIAARNVANRIAQELNTSIGQQVGYQVRFTEQVSENTQIKLMTDGIFLAEIQRDKLLKRYDTIIIDEAHERSLNIDLILGYLKQLLPKRPDLKVIITSATINPKQFSDYFNGAPVMEVSGRGYPVAVNYRWNEKQNVSAAIIACLKEIEKQGSGDVLIFLSGERDIRDTANELRKSPLKEIEILPLYSRLSVTEQQRIFSTTSSKRRVILATNVAETSVTVPNICYVIDTGLARVSRYSHRTKVQRLPIEPIAQANAEQRKGRCGRIAPGVCYRLYAETDFLQRPLFTEPEIQRTNLASVILQLTAMRLGNIENFPFMDPPDPRYIRDAYKVLEEVEALDNNRQLTTVGRLLLKFPLDPRLARIIIAASEYHCLSEILIIVSALSIQDPREYPMDKQDAAREKHRQWQHPDSDFLTFLNLWREIHEQKENLSRKQWREYCTKNYLAYARVVEWGEIYRQLRTIVVEELTFRLNEKEADYEFIHRALLKGLLSRIAQKKDKQDYTGARGIVLKIHPSSGLKKKSPEWLVAAEWLETKQLYANTVAKIEPAWLEKTGQHLLKSSYANPYWEKHSARVMAYEKVTLYGLTIVAKRRTHYGPHDPEKARELFISHALVKREWQTSLAFFMHNKKMLETIEGWEEQTRKRDIVLGEDALYRFYDALIPTTIYTGKALEKYYHLLDKAKQQSFCLTQEQVVKIDRESLVLDDYPGELIIKGISYRLTYTFAPGSDKDGITVHVPITQLAQLTPEPFTWLVPGFLIKKITALLKTLPKNIRRQCVPLPDFASMAYNELCDDSHEQSLNYVMANYLKTKRNIQIDAADFNETQLEPHLLMRFSVYDETGSILAESRDLKALQASLQTNIQSQWDKRSKHSIEKENIQQWDFGDLPETITQEREGESIIAYPALVDKATSTSIELFSSMEAAKKENVKGQLKLFRLHLQQEENYIRKKLRQLEAIRRQYAPIGSEKELLEDCIIAGITQQFLENVEPLTTQNQFESVLAAGKKQFIATVTAIIELTINIIKSWQSVGEKLYALKSRLPEEIIDDMEQQLQALVYPNFIAKTPLKWLKRYPQYFQALKVRLERAEQNPAKDLKILDELKPLLGKKSTELEFPWLLQEYRIALFAQPMKPVVPVSRKKLLFLFQ